MSNMPCSRRLAGVLLTLSFALFIPASAQATVRLAFGYQWYPETSTVNGAQAHYKPDLAGTWPYDSGTPAVIDKQLSSMRYARLQGAVMSWWGQGTRTDQRLGSWLAESALKTPELRHTVYYEAEGASEATVPGAPDPSVSQLTSDLDYLASHYASSAAWLHLNGRPVIFAYGNASESCTTADRWAQANAAAVQRFYVVLKVFAGYQTCTSQPDAWHQYGPAVREDQQGQDSFSISPGFWRADEASPRLARDPATWALNVQHMAAFKGKFQLVTTWNEWGEGTAVESATAWDSPTGNGNYAARLRVDGQVFGSAVPDACHDGLDNNFDGVQDASDPSECVSVTPTPTPTPSPTPSPTPTPTPSPTPTPTPSPTPSPTGGPNATTPCLGTAPAGYQHLVWILEENETQTAITSSSMPYLTGVAGKCGKTTNLKAITHPSLPNYIAMTSGGTQGVTDDANPSSHVLSASNIFAQLGGNTATANWKSLQDGMQSNCALTSGGTKYAPKHNPAAYYSAGAGNVRTACNALDVPYNSSQTPDISKAFTFITPNLNNDGHDTNPTTADNWLKIVLPKILNSATYQAGHTLVVVTWDEGVGSSQTVYTAVIAPSVIPGKVSGVAYTHYSTLRAAEELLGLPLVGAASSAVSWAHDFNLR